jgi:hypothetical protein
MNMLPRLSRGAGGSRLAPTAATTSRRRSDPIKGQNHSPITSRAMKRIDSISSERESMVGAMCSEVSSWGCRRAAAAAAAAAAASKTGDWAWTVGRGRGGCNHVTQTGRHGQGGIGWGWLGGGGMTSRPVRGLLNTQVLNDNYSLSPLFFSFSQSQVASTTLSNPAPITSSPPSPIPHHVQQRRREA